MLNFLRSRRAFFTTLAILLTGVVAFVSDLGGAIDVAKRAFNKQESLVVLQAKLTPMFRNPKVRGNKEEAALSLELRNYGEVPITLTSASIDIVNSNVVKLGRGGSYAGDCVLGSEPNRNRPLTIPPGGTAWLTVSQFVDLRGVSSFFTEEMLEDIFIQPDENGPWGIAQLHYVEDLNRFFGRNYGEGASIKVVLTSISPGEHVLRLPLARGKDLFAKDGSLHHDWFIARWKIWQVTKEVYGYECQSPR